MYYALREGWESKPYLLNHDGRLDYLSSFKKTFYEEKTLKIFDLIAYHLGIDHF